MGPYTWLSEALADCMYIEDVMALRHFIYHPRMNGASNVCLVCGVGTDLNTDDGHLDTCAYVKALKRVEPTGVLTAWIERQ